MSFMEMDWTLSAEQVKATLPSAFKEKFATYAIIDGIEVFIETPSDLFMQSSTWGQNKQHNIAKFFIACTPPNGGICYTPPVYVGSISDIELTHRSSFLTTL